MKERLLENTMKIIDIMCVWDCCWLWLQLQKYVALVVFDPFVELFITLCIVVNTLFMALDHHNMDRDLEKALKSGNYVRSSNLCVTIYNNLATSAVGVEIIFTPTDYVAIYIIITSFAIKFTYLLYLYTKLKFVFMIMI